jgi:hypothetical protein
MTEVLAVHGALNVRWITYVCIHSALHNSISRENC